MHFSKIILGATSAVVALIGASSADEPAGNKAVETFGFLVGVHECDLRHTEPSGKVNAYPVRWQGRKFAGGAGIADDFLPYIGEGQTHFFGTTYRTHSAANGWTSKFFSADMGTWVDVGTKELGGVNVDGDKVSFKAYGPFRQFI